MTPRTTTVPHPARFSKAVLEKIATLCDPSWVCLDPFAGVGGCHWLAANGYVRQMIGVELEPEWASQHPDTICANVFDLPKLFRPETFDAIVVSPVFGNRMSDHHNAKEKCKQCRGTKVFADKPCPRCGGKGVNDYKRLTYKHQLGRDPHPESSTILQWSDAYREFHERAWAIVVSLIKPGGAFILNCKDHIRDDVVQEVTAWHVETLKKLGLQTRPEWAFDVDTPGMGFGQNREKRCDEWVILLRKP